MMGDRLWVAARCWFLIALVLMSPLRAADVRATFSIPSLPADRALREFARQASADVLFAADDVERLSARAIEGTLTVPEALQKLLAGTGLVVERTSRGGFLVKTAPPLRGELKGRITTPQGQPLVGYRVFAEGTGKVVPTDAEGEFHFIGLPPGELRLRLETGAGRDPVSAPIQVEGGRISRMDTWEVGPEREVARLDPFIVQGGEPRQAPSSVEGLVLRPRTAIGNLDLPRHEDGPLNYVIHRRDQIVRSGAVNLGQYLQREMLESEGALRPPGQGASVEGFLGGNNLSLRGFDADETVILVNGRRLPEVVTAGSTPVAPDVNYIPLSLVQQVEILPSSASALYTGNPVGGVINIVLRPEEAGHATEITTNYSNALGRFDAPHASVSFLHGHTWLAGRVRLRVHGSVTHAQAPTESELRFRRSAPVLDPSGALYRATPHVRTTDGTPLFDGHDASFASVAPGTVAAPSLDQLRTRAGVLNAADFDSYAGSAASVSSVDYAYGAKEQRSSWMAGLTYEPRPWVEVGVDVLSSLTRIQRGADLLAADLFWAAAAPGNPFGRDVKVSLLEALPALGESYSRAWVDYQSIVVGVLLRPNAAWRLSLDAQYGRNTTSVRGLAGFDVARWEALLQAGRYHPLRDTQANGPDRLFYDQVLIFQEGRDRSVKVGDYDVIDVAARALRSPWELPTGTGLLQVGIDYRRSHLAAFSAQPRHGDGSDAGERIVWKGRTLQRYSVFSELQAPLWPGERLPPGIQSIDTDLALRYVASDSSRESNLAPTFALRVGLPAGFSVRGSLTQVSRFPTPFMSQRVSTAIPDAGAGVEYASIYDPRRDQRYAVRVLSALQPDLRPESTVTQTFGLLWQRTRITHWRLALDVVQTDKNNELTYLNPAAVMSLEDILPERVTREPATVTDPGRPGPVASVLTGPFNLASRHSRNVTLSLQHRRPLPWGGDFEVYARWLSYWRYERQLFPNQPVVDELDEPDGTAPGLLRHRGKVGVSWQGSAVTLGVDYRYYHRRVLPRAEWPGQGGSSIGSHGEFDLYGQWDLRRWLPAFLPRRCGLLVQARVNNALSQKFPFYANDPANSGVQGYGDWRGRTYSLGATVSF